MAPNQSITLCFTLLAVAGLVRFKGVAIKSVAQSVRLNGTDPSTQSGTQARRKRAPGHVPGKKRLNGKTLFSHRSVTWCMAATTT